MTQNLNFNEGRGCFNRLSASLHVKEDGALKLQWEVEWFQSPFGITACESPAPAPGPRCAGVSFNRLSASLHVKDKTWGGSAVCGKFQSSFGITACESLVFSKHCVQILTFQSPFGITACEREFAIIARAVCKGFNRLSASLHVKVQVTVPRCQPSWLFQSPFGITACERRPVPRKRLRVASVSNAFRHHCM